MSSRKYREASKVYMQARREGKSKEEAKAMSNSTISRIEKDVYKIKSSKNTYEEDSNGWDFDSSLNRNGTNWHTADDL